MSPRAVPPRDRGRPALDKDPPSGQNQGVIATNAVLAMPVRPLIRTLRSGFIHAALLALCLAPGCGTGAGAPDYPELTYRHLAPLEFDVARIEVETRYIPPMRAPNVEHRAPITPYAALRRWAGDRLKGSGRDNIGHLVILDASIREVPLDVQGGIKGFFTSQQSARYDARAVVRLEIRDPGGRQLGFATARAARSLTVSEDSSVADRERVWFALTEDLVADINRQFEIEARRHLMPYFILR